MSPVPVVVDVVAGSSTAGSPRAAQISRAEASASSAVRRSAVDLGLGVEDRLLRGPQLLVGDVGDGDERDGGHRATGGRGPGGGLHGRGPVVGALAGGRHRFAVEGALERELGLVQLGLRRVDGCVERAGVERRKRRGHLDMVADGHVDRCDGAGDGERDRGLADRLDHRGLVEGLGDVTLVGDGGPVARSVVAAGDRGLCDEPARRQRPRCTRRRCARSAVGGVRERRPVWRLRRGRRAGVWHHSLLRASMGASRAARVAG